MIPAITPGQTVHRLTHSFVGKLTGHGATVFNVQRVALGFMPQVDDWVTGGRRRGIRWW